VYESKAMFEFMIGEAREREENYTAAREAYGRSLAEDLSFAFVHARLARLSLAQNDPLAAVAEYDQAVQLEPKDPVLHHDYGRALLGIYPRRDTDAEQQFRQAIALDPDWSMPYFSLAEALTNQKKYDDALTQYREYMARVPRNNIQMLDLVTERMDQVKKLVAANGGAARQE
jgi:tetratricopeptide (TPR) repeat protein